MRKLYTLIALFVVALTMMAQSSADKTINLSYVPAAFYTPATETTLASYYFVASSVSGDYSTGDLYAPSGWVLSVDFTNDGESGEELPEGTYTKGDGSKSFTYDAAGSMVEYHNASNTVTESYELQEDVVVSKNTRGQYVITTTFTNKFKMKNTMRFVGNWRFNNSNNTTDYYNQLTHHINTTFTGGFASYYGNLYQSNTGNMLIRLYDCEFEENGAMKEGAEGYALELMVFGPLFGNPADAEVAPGHYVVARNFTRDTWFPGMEIDYMGITMAFGTFAQEKRNDPSFGSDGYAWAYASNGTIDIEDAGEGKVRIKVDLKSKTGYDIRGTFEGVLPVRDLSDDRKGAVVSTLTSDLALNLSYLNHAHIYDNGIQGETNTRSFTVDLGSDMDPDGSVLPEIDSNPYGADVMRLEFLTAVDAQNIPEGTYQVMEENYTTYYAPFRMRQGYFANGGEITGTRWMHLAPNRYYVMDGHAPAYGGSVSVEHGGTNTEGEKIYTFRINLIDDAEFNITGSWTGPVVFHEGPDASIGQITVDTPQRGAIFDLQGRQQVRAPKAGCYIQDGAKKLVR